MRSKIIGCLVAAAALSLCSGCYKTVTYWSTHTAIHPPARLAISPGGDSVPTALADKLTVRLSSCLVKKGFEIVSRDAAEYVVLFEWGSTDSLHPRILPRMGMEMVAPPEIKGDQFVHYFFLRAIDASLESGASSETVWQAETRLVNAEKRDPTKPLQKLKTLLRHTCNRFGRIETPRGGELAEVEKLD